MYPTDRAPWDLEPHYSDHVSAMTAESLHDKGDIALQLALRDHRIAELEATVKAMRVERNEAYDAGRDGLPNPFSDDTEPLP